MKKQNQNQIEIYQASDGSTQINVQFEQDTVWLTQAQMAALFETTIPNINIHLKNIFSEGEQIEKATIKESLIVQLEGWNI